MNPPLPLSSLARDPDDTDCRSYFVTELLGTDLHRLLTSRPLEKQFIQYFLYQILVRSKRPRKQCGSIPNLTGHSEV